MKEKRREARRLSAAACLLSTAEKRTIHPRRLEMERLREGRGRVKRDSKIELLNLDPGCRILKETKFAHRVFHSWKPSARLSCQNVFQHECKTASPWTCGVQLLEDKLRYFRSYLEKNLTQGWYVGGFVSIKIINTMLFARVEPRRDSGAPNISHIKCLAGFNSLYTSSAGEGGSIPTELSIRRHHENT